MAKQTEKATSDVVAAWPQFKGRAWPLAAGPQPTATAIETALACNRAGTSVALAAALRARPDGATASEVSIATLVTGNSGQHRNKLADLLQAGRYVVTAGTVTAKGNTYKAKAQLEQRGGQTALRIALKGKATPTGKGKVAKGKAKAKPVAPADTAPVTGDNAPADTGNPANA